MYDKSRPVLVTGGAGYIGAHAAHMLLDDGFSVVVADNLSTGRANLVPDAAKLEELDIGDPAALAAIFSKHRFGAVMHFAGSIVVPESVKEPLKYYRNNTAASRNLIEAAVDAGTPHFVFSSTAAVYGIQDVALITETTPTAPINPYGKSKLMTEWMLADATAAHPFNAGVLRYFNVAGADQQGRAGQANPAATHLIKIGSQVATGQRPLIEIFGTDYPTPDGTCVRDYVHVSDLVRAHMDLLHRLAAEPGQNHTFNCGYGRGFSVKDVLSAFDRLTNYPIERKEGARRPGDAPQLVADNTRLRAELGWVPAHDDLETIVRDALAWERKLSAMS